MSKEKQIDEKHELSESIYMSGHGLDRKDSDDIAEQLYHEGYRKQSEGQHQIPRKIGSKIYEVTGEPGEQIDIDEYTVSEVGLNGVFTSGGWPCYRSHRHYFAYSDEGVWWFFSKEDAEAEKKRRDDP